MTPDPQQRDVLTAQVEKAERSDRLHKAAMDCYAQEQIAQRRDYDALKAQVDVLTAHLRALVDACEWEHAPDRLHVADEAKAYLAALLPPKETR